MADNDKIFEYGINFKHRYIYYTDVASDELCEINDKSINIVINAIKVMELQSKRPITLFFNSIGGDIYSALNLIDVILSTQCQIKFIGGGKIMSAASLIMVVCDERYLYPNSTVMLHYGSDTFDGSYTDHKIDILESNRLRDTIINILCTNSKMPASWWGNILARDIYLTAEQALTLGLIDGIITPIKRGNLRKKRLYNMKRVNIRQLNKLVKSINKMLGLNQDLTLKIEPQLTIIDQIDPSVVIETEIENTTNINKDVNNHTDNNTISDTNDILNNNTNHI